MKLNIKSLLKKTIEIGAKLSFIVVCNIFTILSNINEILNSILNNGNLDSYFGNVKTRFNSLDNKVDKALFIFEYAFAIYSVICNINFYAFIFIVMFIFKCAFSNVNAKTLFNF